MRQQQCCYQDDPGLIFDIKIPGDVHFCLGLPTTNTVRPQPRQGRDRKCSLFIIYNFDICLGTSANESVQNLYDWLDRLILRFCTNDVFVYNSSGRRKYGWYQAMTGRPYTKFMNNLSSSLRGWGTGGFSRGRSCGTQICGAGTGVVTIEPLSLGPFWKTIECVTIYFYCYL